MTKEQIEIIAQQPQKVVEAFVAGAYVATAPELQHLHTRRETSMSQAFKAATEK